MNPKRPATANEPVARRGRPLSDFARGQQQLRQHREHTLELLWAEYREQHPSVNTYSYSRFCKL